MAIAWNKIYLLHFCVWRNTRESAYVSENFRGFPNFLNLFYKFIYLFLFLAVLGLRVCARAFSSCGKRGPLFIAVRGPLTVAASLCGAQATQWRAGSVVVAHGPSRSAACGIFPDQGSNPCPLHWQADSQPLCHQGSPEVSQIWQQSIIFMTNNGLWT